MTPGGLRPGAGRPKGRFKYGERTKTMRVPLSRISEVMAFLEQSVPIRLPFYSSKVRAGFPSPADDDIEAYLDLNEHLIDHPAATFMVRASGDSMLGIGIHDGDLLVVDRHMEATHGKIVIAAIGGELTVKRLSLKGGRVQLIAANPNYPPMDITEDQDMVIWGVVKHVIHSLD